MSIFFIFNVLYPYFLCGFLFFIVQTILKKNKLLLTINLTVFLFVFFLLGPIYVFGDSFSEKSENSIKVLTLNAFQFNGYLNRGDNNFGQTFEGFIDDNKPDIICLQEFSKTYKIPLIVKNYPYYYVNYKTRYTKYSPLTIFSKYPIIEKGSLDFPNSVNNSIYVDIALPKDTLRVYNIHLQSLKVRPGSIKRERPYNLLNRLGSSYKMQLQQAELVKEHYKNAPYKAILCGDFNNTQHSGIIKLFSDEMKDSFIEKGNGFGSTYYFKFLPFRIDYIFTDNSIEIIDHQNFDVKLSDHYPVMATVQLRTD
jgi:endonuclease/exonuclease/phosphatase family metal-dependent hydrolase